MSIYVNGVKVTDDFDDGILVIKIKYEINIKKILILYRCGF